VTDAVARAVAVASATVEREDGDDVPGLEQALAALDAADAWAEGDHDRATLDAWRAQVLERLGRPREAGACYARALLAEGANAQALEEGARELLDRLGALEEAERVAVAARERHPGRAWQWDAIAQRARALLALERDAPLAPGELAALREDVARRLALSPCDHGDDRRPATVDALRARGLDPARVLPWLSAVGACCCDCQVARVRGPREPRDESRRR
jgi:tetratricopeptide (TPR) repeat protein